MLDMSINSFREEKAKFIRDIEYLREMSDDDFTDSTMNYLESIYGESDSYEDYKELSDMMESIEIDENDEKNEIQKILESTDDISFDDMLGVDDILES